MFSWLVAVVMLLLNGRVVLQGVHRAPPDGGLVHVLLIGQPDVQSVGVIELAAKGDLTLNKTKYFRLRLSYEIS